MSEPVNYFKRSFSESEIAELIAQLAHSSDHFRKSGKWWNRFWRPKEWEEADSHHRKTIDRVNRVYEAGQFDEALRALNQAESLL